MRIIKLALISFVILFVIVTLMSLLIPSRLRISRATNLAADRSQVFQLLKAEQSWHPAYLDTASAARMATLKKSPAVETDSALTYTLQQPGRQPVANGYRLYGYKGADSLTLQWYMDFNLRWYPWEKFSSLFYESTYGRMMEGGLSNIRKQLSN